MNRSPSSSIWRVCPFPHFFWPKGRVAAHSLLQTLPYPTHIIANLFPRVKQLVLLQKFFQVTFAEPVKCHDRILKSRFIGFQHKPYNNIQVRIRQFFHAKTVPICLLSRMIKSGESTASRPYCSNRRRSSGWRSLCVQCARP